MNITRDPNCETCSETGGCPDCDGTGFGDGGITSQCHTCSGTGECPECGSVAPDLADEEEQ